MSPLYPFNEWVRKCLWDEEIDNIMFWQMFDHHRHLVMNFIFRHYNNFLKRVVPYTMKSISNRLLCLSLNDSCVTFPLIATVILFKKIMSFISSSKKSRSSSEYLSSLCAHFHCYSFKQICSWLLWLPHSSSQTLETIEDTIGEYDLSI
jgi:hypothetical protein